MTAGIGCYVLSFSIGNYKFFIDFIVLEFQGLDVILGMDWLVKYKGNIDCVFKFILFIISE